jgi:hypothetical protein
MALQRPTLLPGLSRIWRDAHTLQLGGDPARAVLVDLPDRGAADLLDLIDGTRPERVLLRHAARHGIPLRVAEALLRTLHEAGLVVSAPALLPTTLPESDRRRLLSEAGALAHRKRPAARALRRRAAARVRIAGEGRLGASIAVALAESGVGHVDVDLPGTVTPEDLPGGPLRVADIGSARVEAVTSAVLRAAPKIETRSVRRTAATLLVQLRYREPVPLLAAALARRRQPHLAVAIHQGVAVIGPFVPAAGRPCLQCLDLHRRDRDPGWSETVPAFEPCTVVTLLAATAYATEEALTFIDGGIPETRGVSAEMTAPGHLRRKTWPPHPSCSCAI